MDKTIIWHNNVCSTSRNTLNLLEVQTGRELTVRNYMEQAPSIEELQHLLEMMGEKPSYLLRRKEEVFQQKFADKELSDAEWLEAMSQHPSIIERPIVIIGEKAYLARPFEDFAQKLIAGVL